MIDFDKVKVGDKVRCVNGSRWSTFTRGGIYEVTKVNKRTVKLDGIIVPNRYSSDFVTAEDAETDQRVAKLERELEALKRAIMEEQKEWEPEGGEHTATAIMARPTREQADRAAEKMRIYNRALAYVDEHAPDWDGDDPYDVAFDENADEWAAIPIETSNQKRVGAVTGPAWVMQKLAKDLNSGRVKL